MTCNACNRTIYDRLMSKTSPDNKIWHSDCLKCCECHKLLDSKYFETSGRLYCRNDYLAYFGPTCFGCAAKITDDQYFFSIKHQPGSLEAAPAQTQSSNNNNNNNNNNNSINSLFFHDKCFACNYCARPLQKGDKYCILEPTPLGPQPGPKSLMICHDICALKYHSSGSSTPVSGGVPTPVGLHPNTVNNNNNNNNTATNPLLAASGPPMQPAPARAKRGRMKQNNSRPV